MIMLRYNDFVALSGNLHQAPLKAQGGAYQGPFIRLFPGIPAAFFAESVNPHEGTGADCNPDPKHSAKPDRTRAAPYKLRPGRAALP